MRNIPGNQRNIIENIGKIKLYLNFLEFDTIFNYQTTKIKYYED